MKLRQIFEAPGKTAVAAFGRMNPPTIGHEKLVDAVKKQQGDHFLFLSHTQDKKENPLTHSIKKQYTVNFFQNITIGDNEVRTPIQMLQKLEKQGYTDVIYVAGSDRVDQFDKLFNDYNGNEYNFNSITVISAGERDPDAKGAEGMSASKMRQAAVDGNLEAFSQGVPDKKLAKNLFQAVRDGMEVKDEVPAEGLDEGDLVLDKTSLLAYLRDKIYDWASKEDDIDKISDILKQIEGKTVKARDGKRYTISNEDIEEVLRNLKAG